MKTLFITPSDNRWASSRLRAAWPARYMQDAACVRYGEHETIEADNYIFIKIMDAPFMQAKKAQCRRVYYDVCDPAWWWNESEVAQIAEKVDGVCASNEALRMDFAVHYPDVKTFTIPDRIEFGHYAIQRTHADVSPVRMIWYGAAQNRVALFGALVNLERLTADGIPTELTIFDDHPEQAWNVSDMIRLYHTRWNLANENGIIASHDIALLPPYPGPWGKVKSNNKAMTALACGIPWVDGWDYAALRDIVTDWRLRQEAVDTFTPELHDKYDVRLSAQEWEKVLDD